MAQDFGLLNVERLVIHEIPRRRAEDNVAFRCADLESELQNEDRNLFSERIRKSLSKSAYGIAFESENISPQETHSSPVPKLIFRTLNSENSENDNFVSISRSIAQHLFSSQTGVNPAGLLVVATASIGILPCLVILKLEKEDGVQFQSEENADGLITYNVKQLSNLMLTGGKVFKIGLFIKDGGDISSIRGFASDKQRSSGNSEVATFFLKKFLGCKLLEDPKILTKKFFRASEEFINERINDPDIKKNYEIALIAALNSSQGEGVVNPVDFAQSYLNIEDRQNYLNFLVSSGLPETSFNKDTSDLKSYLKKMHLQLALNNFDLSMDGHPNSFETISIEELESGKVRITFEADFKKVGK